MNLALAQCPSYQLSLHELNQIIEIELLASCFLQKVWFLGPISTGANARFAPLPTRMARTKNRCLVIQLWFCHFAATFFKSLGIHFSNEDKEKDKIHRLVVRAFHSCLPWMCGHDLFKAFSIFKALSVCDMSSSQHTLFSTFSVLTSRRTSEAAHCIFLLL